MNVDDARKVIQKARLNYPLPIPADVFDAFVVGEDLCDEVKRLQKYSFSEGELTEIISALTYVEKEFLEDLENVDSTSFYNALFKAIEAKGAIYELGKEGENGKIRRP